jgi:chromatin assembly factor 1 subunit A
VSSVVEDFKAAKSSAASRPDALTSTISSRADNPNLAGSSNLPLPPATVSSTPTGNAKAPLAKPKTAFPDALLPMLISKIDSLATGSFNAIVDSLYLDLRTHKVKKNAIEAKVREVCEKHKEKRVWTVKDDIRVSKFAY